MKSLIALLAILTLMPLQAESRQRDIYKIEIGKNYEKHSKRELRRRVWELERAVAQLQDQVFQLAMDNNRPGQKEYYGEWTCTLQSMGKTYTSTKTSKGAAKAEVMKSCSNATNAIHCKAKDVSCEK